jgi:hypothetical protein
LIPPPVRNGVLKAFDRLIELYPATTKPEEVKMWLWSRGHEADFVRAFWPTLGDNITVSGVSLLETLGQSARHSRLVERRAREIEELVVEL